MVYFLNTRRAVANLSMLVLVAFLSISGCNGDNILLNEPPVEESSAEIKPANERAPLSRVLEVRTPVETRIAIDIGDGTNTSHVEFEGFSTSHSLPVLGLRPGRANTVLVSAIDEPGETVFQTSLEVATDPLPENFPQLEVTSDPELMEPGVTLFESGGFVIMVDETGEVVWYYEEPGSTSFDRDVRRMQNGNLLLLLPVHNIIEIDMLGNTVRSWYTAQTSEGSTGGTPVDAAAFHHEAFAMENGNILAMSGEMREFPDYPSSTTNPDAPLETANVVGDVIVEFAPDGTVVNEFHLLDIIDPYRLGYSSLISSWDGFFQNNFGFEGTTRDWTHGNAVIHDTRDDSLIISLRHQDAVIKIDRQTGGLIWILGTHSNWDPGVFGPFLLNPDTDDELFFQYHQHAPMITEEGNIMLFDNGNFRASPFEPVFPEDFSRAIEYSIDESSMDVSIVWESTGFSPEPIYAGFLGDADKLPQTGNVLITFGGRRPAIIAEVTHTTPPVKVFEIIDPNNFMYRAERLPGVYP
ncbi:MAG: arylsulfotransferase family protein [Candidatus Dadabacteria bacterium]|nr:arylsulfotransferase family protein [Candidatus Dadabacteria bacterium]